MIVDYLVKTPLGNLQVNMQAALHRLAAAALHRGFTGAAQQLSAVSTMICQLYTRICQAGLVHYSTVGLCTYSNTWQCFGGENTA